MYTHKLLHLIAILTVLFPAPLVFGAGVLSGSDILLTLDTYDHFTELLNSRTDNKLTKPEDKVAFNMFLIRFTAESNETEAQACHEKSIDRNRYKLIFDRVFMVKTYLTHKEIRDELVDEIKRREAMTEAELDREAEKSYREMEQWYDRVGGNVTLEDVKKKCAKELKQYIDSIAEQNRKIEEYNRNLSSNQTIAGMQEKISFMRAKLTDPRYSQFHDKIERDIAQLEKLMARQAKKDKRREKSKKKPDPLILKKINKPVETYQINRENSFYATLIQDVRNKKTSGQWRQAVRDSNRKKVLELRASVNKLDKILADSHLKQAALDADIVKRVVDRARLMALSPLPWQQNIPGY